MKASLIPVEEYLHSNYRPDRDYIDGEPVERNVGEFDHSDLQGHIYAYFLARRREFGLYPVIEQRIRIAQTRYRVPDICLVQMKPPDQIVSDPPVLVIEILSPEDRMSRMRERIDDYLRFGVPNVWLINPRTRRAEVFTRAGSSAPSDGVLRIEAPKITLSLNEIFQEMDRAG